MLLFWMTVSQLTTTGKSFPAKCWLVYFVYLSGSIIMPYSTIWLYSEDFISHFVFVSNGPQLYSLLILPSVFTWQNNFTTMLFCVLHAWHLMQSWNERCMKWPQNEKCYLVHFMSHTHPKVDLKSTTQIENFSLGSIEYSSPFNVAYYIVYFTAKTLQRWVSRKDPHLHARNPVKGEKIEPKTPKGPTRQSKSSPSGDRLRLQTLEVEDWKAWWSSKASCRRGSVRGIRMETYPKASALWWTVKVYALTNKHP